MLDGTYDRVLQLPPGGLRNQQRQEPELQKRLEPLNTPVALIGRAFEYLGFWASSNANMHSNVHSWVKDRYN